VVCDNFEDQRFEEIVEASTLAGCRVLSMSRLDRLGRVHPTLVWHRGVPLVQLSVPMLKAQQLLVKRIIDLVGASVGLVLLAPIFVIIAAAIRLDSRGAVFFSHERVGLGGRVFKMLKFRTMRNGADSEKAKYAHLNHTGDPRLFKIPNDPRVTRIGAWLRRWSLDELPQLWNVLAGDMSLVGPRPFFESDLAEYSDHHFVRLSAKPGITGLWQIMGRSSLVDFEEVVRLDRQYIDRWSVWLDLAILVRTGPAVIRRTGAY
jgi:exopolysaccharide biosynthesis polyprenyl glycosylphosphotransferase